MFQKESGTTKTIDYLNELFTTEINIMKEHGGKI